MSAMVRHLGPRRTTQHFNTHCVKCMGSTMTAEPAVVCGGCGDSAHCRCIGLGVQPRLPYHCDHCLQGYQRQAKKDITLQ